LQRVAAAREGTLPLSLARHLSVRGAACIGANGVARVVDGVMEATVPRWKGRSKVESCALALRRELPCLPADLALKVRVGYRVMHTWVAGGEPGLNMREA